MKVYLDPNHLFNSNNKQNNSGDVTTALLLKLLKDKMKEEKKKPPEKKDEKKDEKKGLEKLSIIELAMLLFIMTPFIGSVWLLAFSYSLTHSVTMLKDIIH